LSSNNWQKNLDPDSPAYSFAADENETCRSLAGPGTGKTFGLMRKIAYLLEEKGIDPDKILIITFTRAGAADIQKELIALEIDGVNKIHSSTLHSFCMGVLMQREVIDANNRQPRPLLEYETKPLLYDVNVDKIFGDRTIKACGVLLTDYESAWARLQVDEPGFTQTDVDVEFQKRMDHWMEFHQAMTIGEIIPFALQFMRANPAHPSYHRFEYVLVDEYQDLNKAEQVVIDEIARGSNLVVVGDDNQSIYSFKNAHPEGIREFSETHDPCADILMQECRRCPTSVVAVADSLIRNDAKYKHRNEPVLIPFEPNGEGEVDVIQWATSEEEALGIANIVNKILDENGGLLEPQDVLVLNPSKVIVRMIADTLNELSVPSQVVASNVKVILNCDEARRVHALLTYLSNRDDRVSFRYLIRKNNNFHSDQYLAIQQMAQESNLSPAEVLLGIVDGVIEVEGIRSSSAIVKRYVEMQEIIQTWEALDNLDDLITELDNLGGEDSHDLIKRIQSLQEGFEPEENDIGIAIQFARIIVKNILDLATTADNIDEEKSRVMTYHSAKGLSGKLVIVSGCVDGLIPRLREDTTQADLDEQRRLFYVAITRCKHTDGGFPGKLILSSFQRMGEGKKKQLGVNVPYRGVHASRFLSEIDAKIFPQALLGNEYLKDK